MPAKQYWKPPEHEPKAERSTKQKNAPAAPYTYPHMCESEQVAEALARLPAQKRRVLRSYIWHVELGSKRVGEWLAMGDCPISPAAWYRSAGKNYLRDAYFLDARDIYVARALVWQSTAEATAVQQAAHKLRLHSLNAVEQLIEMMATGEKDADKIRAAATILDRADIATAVKSSQEVSGPDGGPVQIYLPDNGREGGDPDGE